MSTQQGTRSRPLLLMVLALGALVAGAGLSLLSPTFAIAAVCGAAFALAILLQRFYLVLLAVLVVRLLIDYYGLVTLPSYFPLVAPILAAVVLAVLFLWQPEQHRWVRLPYWWLFGLLILLTALSLRHATSLADGVAYFINGVVSAALFWMLGIQLARDVGHLRRILTIQTAIGTVIALHGLIAVRTGTYLLASPNLAIFLAGKGGLILSGTNTIRLGSFLLNPDTAGAFLALMGILAVGLAFSASSLGARVLFGAEAGLIFLAQVLTLSTSSFIALAAGLFVFTVLMFRHAFRAAFILIGVVLVGTVGFVVAFPTETRVILRHVQTPGEWSLRLGAWQTGWNVISAHPLTGIGLGTSTYLARSLHYLSPLQTVPLAVPENSYLEIAAMSGLPVILLFLTLVGCMAWLIFRAYRLAEPKYRALFAAALGAMAILSVDSLAANCWTIAPTLAFAWLLVGAASSPSLTRSPQGVAVAESTPVPRGDSAIAPQPVPTLAMGGPA